MNKSPPLPDRPPSQPPSFESTSPSYRYHLFNGKTEKIFTVINIVLITYISYFSLDEIRDRNVRSIDKMWDEITVYYP